MPQENQPLIFTPYLSETIWGGQRLSTRLGKKLPPDTLIGESWELSALAGRETIVADGPLKGIALGTLFTQNATSLVGPHISGSVSFPLLVKFIDARDRLSIQVHPDDSYARSRLGQPYGKTECWYIVDAGTDGTLGIGFKEDVTEKQLRYAIEKNTIGQLLNTVKVRSGEVFFIPAGTVHSILADLLIYEIQQSSDVTFRLYDWQRKDADGNSRPLSIDEGIAATTFLKRDTYRIDPLAIPHKQYRHAVRALCDFFVLEEFNCDHPASFILPMRSSCRILSVLRGSMEIAGEGFMRKIRKGTTFLLPASCASVTFYTAEHCHFLMTSIPDGKNDIVAELEKVGYTSEEINSLK